VIALQLGLKLHQILQANQVLFLIKMYFKPIFNLWRMHGATSGFYRNRKIRCINTRLRYNRCDKMPMEWPCRHFWDTWQISCPSLYGTFPNWQADVVTINLGTIMIFAFGNPTPAANPKRVQYVLVFHQICSCEIS
jgi:hypothetical protein